MSSLGWVHTVFGMIALLAGTAVILIKKGTRWHRTLGHVYLTTMLGLNISSFLIYELFGGFGAFHWMAVASLLTLMLGMVPVITRRPKRQWLTLHGAFVSGSYVGLIAAAASEIIGRAPNTGEFRGTAVALTTTAIISLGMLLIHRNLNTAARMTPNEQKQRTPENTPFSA